MCINVGIDIGYFAVKSAIDSQEAPEGRKNISYRTAISPYKAPIVSFGDKSRVMSYSFPDMDEGKVYAFGEEAIDFQKGAVHNTGRTWIESDAYKMLFRVGIAESGIMNGVKLHVVSGLPVKYYKRDAATVKQQLLGQHTFKQIESNVFSFDVESVTVYPQVVGTLMSLAMSNGKIINKNILESRCAIADIGGGTSDFGMTYKSKAIESGTDSEHAGFGMWDVILYLRDLLLQKYPSISLSDLDASSILLSGRFRVDGVDIDVSMEIQESKEIIAQAIIEKMMSLWQDFTKIDYIFITGGGGLALFPEIKKRIKRAELALNPIFANVNGYLELARYAALKGK